MTDAEAARQTTSKRRSDARNQHHVPRMLQSAFAKEGKGKTKQIQVFDKQTGRSYSTAIEKNFAARDFNTYEEDGAVLCLEDAMGAIEDLAAPVIRKIIFERSIAGLDAEERAKLCSFAALQKMRGVALRAQMGDMTETLREKLGAQGDDPDKIRELRGGNGAEDLKLLALNIIRENLGEFSQSFDNKTLCLIQSAPNETFLLGDTPVTWMNKTDTGAYGSLGLEVKGIEIYLPIAPDLCLAFWCPSLLQQLEGELARAQADVRGLAGEAILGLGERQQVAKRKRDAAQAFIDRVQPRVVAIATGAPVPSNADNMAYLNSLQVSQAERFVASSDGDFRLVRQMIADNEKYRGGMRIQVS